jgi:hypothetical protein
MGTRAKGAHERYTQTGKINRASNQSNNGLLVHRENYLRLGHTV